MKIENLELYSQIFNYGKLTGQLETLARINDKKLIKDIFLI